MAHNSAIMQRRYRHAIALEGSVAVLEYLVQELRQDKKYPSKFRGNLDRIRDAVDFMIQEDQRVVDGTTQ